MAPSSVKEKRCRICNDILTVGINQTSGRARYCDNICTNCKSEQNRQIYQANTETRREYQRDYYSKHREAIREYQTSYEWREKKFHAECLEHEACRVSRVSKRAVYGMDAGHCRIRGPRCPGFVPYALAQLDHIVPYTRGGKHCWYNVQTSCEPCNRWKSNHTDVESTLEISKGDPK